MKQRVITHIFALALFALALASCGTAHKIIKGGDPEQIYQLAMKYYDQERWSKASETFEMVQPYFEGTERDDTLAFYNSRCKYRDRDYSGAAAALDAFRRSYGRSPFIEDVEGMYAMCYYYLSPGPTRDQTTTQQAMLIIDEFLTRYPHTDKRETFDEIYSELQWRVYEKDYINAYTYYKIGRYKSAIYAFKNAIKRHPESHHREDMLYYTICSGYELAKNSITVLQDDRFLNVLDSYYTFMADYPESAYMPDVERMVKQTRDYLASREAASEAAAAEAAAAEQSSVGEGSYTIDEKYSINNK